MTVEQTAQEPIIINSSVKAEMPKPHKFMKCTEARRNLIIDFIKKYTHASPRQLFYQAVVKLGITNNKNSCNKMDFIINDLRYEGLIPFDSITDSTNIYGKTYFDSIEECVTKAIETYHYDWNYDFDEYVEVWLEKQALADTVSPATGKYNVDLRVSGGRTNVSQVHSFINTANRINKPTTILYLGDFDPTGLDIDRRLAEQIQKQNKYITFPQPVTIKRIAITEAQRYNLKENYEDAKTGDNNTKKYVGKYGKKTWELDAFEPEDLQQIICAELEKYRPIAKVELNNEIDDDDKEEIRQKLKAKLGDA